MRWGCDWWRRRGHVSDERGTQDCCDVDGVGIAWAGAITWTSSSPEDVWRVPERLGNLVTVSLDLND